MIKFPNCKINIGLYVTEKRADGFHNLETIFYPVPLKDVLEIMPSQKPAPSITIHGLTIDGDANNNLCIKAWHLLKKDYHNLPVTDIYLIKKVPMGAGLGGGSADGAFMLQLLNEEFQLQISSEKLLEYALQLGSDCPFFIHNNPCFATGRGELMEPFSLSLAGYTLVINNPGIHINTGWAFRQLNLSKQIKRVSLKELVQLPIRNWKNKLSNDFEPIVFAQYPTVALLKKHLYEAGALYASMSGSGSTVFGIFDKNIAENSLLPAGSAVINL